MAGSRSSDLARRAARGDRAALEALWREHRRFVAAILLAHRPPGADLEDLLQEVAVSVCEHIGKLREPERILPWLRSIALNRVRSAGRKEGVRGRVLRRLDPGEEPEAPPDAAGDEGRRVREALARLKEEYREPLYLKGVEGWSQRRIAAALVSAFAMIRVVRFELGRFVECDDGCAVVAQVRGLDGGGEAGERSSVGSGWLGGKDAEIAEDVGDGGGGVVG